MCCACVWCTTWNGFKLLMSSCCSLSLPFCASSFPLNIIICKRDRRFLAAFRHILFAEKRIKPKSVLTYDYSTAKLHTAISFRSSRLYRDFDKWMSECVYVSMCVRSLLFRISCLMFMHHASFNVIVIIIFFSSSIEVGFFVSSIDFPFLPLYSLLFDSVFILLLLYFLFRVASDVMDLWVR